MPALASRLFHQDPTVSGVIESVPKPEELTKAEADLAALQERSRELSAEFGRLSEIININPAHRNRAQTQIDNAIRRRSEIGAELERIRTEAAALTRTIESNRADYAMQLTAAMALVRRGAAEKVVAALAGFREAQTLLDDSSAALIAASGRPARLVPLVMINAVEQSAKKIIDESKQHW